jgi:hypothetical protein
MRSPCAWPVELDGLLSKFDALPSLVVRNPPDSTLAHVPALRSLVPFQLGLPNHVAQKTDWDLLHGGLLYAADLLDDAHALFQGANSPEGSYWHGMMHRREGDFENARYWLSRAGAVEGIARLPSFSPTAFASECEESVGRDECPAHLLEMQRMEWESMMLWSWQRLATPS